MIKTFSQLCLLAFLVTFLTTGLINSHASSNTLVISEIAYKGTTAEDNCKASSSSTFNCGHDKWVELYNTTSSSIDLSQYRLAYGRQGSGYTENRQLSGTISPNGYFVVANKTNNALTNIPQVDLLISNMHFMSANSGDKYVKIALLDTKANVIDKVELDNSQISSLESGFNFTQARFSIEIKDGISSVNQANSYGRSPLYKNYGTPGFGFLTPLPEAPKPIPATSPIIVVEPIIIPPLPKAIEVIIPIAQPQPVLAPIAIIEPAPVSAPVSLNLPEVPAAQLPATAPVAAALPVTTLATSIITELMIVQESVPQAVQDTKTSTASINTEQINNNPIVNQSKAQIQLNSFVSGDIANLTNLSNFTIAASPIIPTILPAIVLTNSQDTIKPLITPAVAASKISQSHYELILTLVALMAAMFVGYIVFDYNYSRIEYSYLDKFTNIVSY